MIADLAIRFTTSANAGDATAVASTFAPDARFDSVGRIYADRTEIMQRFLIPEVFNAGGRYEVKTTEWKDGRYVVHYDFSTRSGAEETFYYAFLVRDGLIRDVVGRYE